MRNRVLGTREIASGLVQKTRVDNVKVEYK